MKAQNSKFTQKELIEMWREHHKVCEVCGCFEFQHTLKKENGQFLLICKNHGVCNCVPDLREATQNYLSGDCIH
jgi:translation initiation factor 2 beta subunit (eIF-2beta)/eIF-5